VRVGIDTMILLWAMPEPHFKGKKQINQDVAEMQRRALLLLSTLQEEDADVVVPTITASEWLAGIDPVKHGTFLAKLDSFFTLAPFDPPSAALAAKLFQKVYELPKAEKPTRVCLKADVMIIASAKISGAAKFYSHDEKVRKIAVLAGMAGIDLPTNGNNLFAEIPADKPPKKSDKKT
jgi:predicted nucleic acid-binding protein